MSPDEQTTDLSLAPEWYLFAAGEYSGPLTPDEIKVQIHLGKINQMSLVYRAGAERWQILNEIDEFSAAFQDYHQARTHLHPTWAPKNRGEWVILRANGAGPRVSGPFERNQLFEMLSVGELSYSDFVWKTGENAWTRVGNRRDLDRRQIDVSETEVEPSPAAENDVDFEVDFLTRISADAILQNVTRFSRVPANAGADELPDELREEVSGEDLAAGTPASLKNLALLMIAFSLSFVLSPAPSYAHTLDVVTLKTAMPQPLLVFPTDAPVGEKIKIQLSAALGDVPGVTNFRQDVEIVRSAGEIPTLELAPLKLGRGTYQVVASVAGVQKSATFFLGTRDTKFEEERSKFAKKVSLAQQREKKLLFYSAKKMESLARKLALQFAGLSKTGNGAQEKWENFAADWIKDLKSATKEIKRISIEEAPAYPAQVVAFTRAESALRQELVKLTNAIEQKRSVAGAAAVASFSAPVTALEKEFLKIKLESSKATSQL